MKMLRVIFFILVYCVVLSAHTVDSTSIDTLRADTLTSTSSVDTLPYPGQAAKDAEKSDKMNLIKRSFNHRQQVFLGIGMMVFIAVIMSSAQSWNPRN